jgi:3-dehydroquinate synthetase
MLGLMSVDKKAAGGEARFVVLDAIGRAELRGGIDERMVREVVVAAAQ